MAWLSVGTSNDDLCQKLIENDVLQPGRILEAFRATDRGDFVAAEDRIQAYTDRPFKKGKIHLSAPHMYATVLEALDLRAGKSFLNVGSGSGYLSCLAAFLLGEEGVSHGVEICESVYEFSKERAKLWHTKLSNNPHAPHTTMIAMDGVSFVNANCFDIDVLSAVSTFKYDRIYVGAGCPDSRKEFFLSMLADDGILVVPINEKNQMLSIRKFFGRVFSIKPISNVNFAPLVDTAVRPDEEEMLQELATQEGKTLGSDIETSILKVQSAPSASSFIIHPIAAPVSAFAGSTAAIGSNRGSMEAQHRVITHRVRLPPLVWAPVRKRHMQFPAEFRRAVFTVLLANNRYQSGTVETVGPGAATVATSSNHSYSYGSCSAGYHKHGCKCGGCAFLPHQLWLQIFTFANRDWFCAGRSEVQVLSMELAVERRLRRGAEERLRKAEEARRAAERERDVFRIAVMRLSRRSKGHSSGQQGHGFSHGLGLGAFIDMDDLDEEDDEEGDDSGGDESHDDNFDQADQHGDGDGGEDFDAADSDDEDELEDAMEQQEEADESESEGHSGAEEQELEQVEDGDDEDEGWEIGEGTLAPTATVLVASPAHTFHTTQSHVSDYDLMDVIAYPAAEAQAEAEAEEDDQTYHDTLQPAEYLPISVSVSTPVQMGMQLPSVSSNLSALLSAAASNPAPADATTEMTTHNASSEAATAPSSSSGVAAACSYLSECTAATGTTCETSGAFSAASALAAAHSFTGHFSSSTFAAGAHEAPGAACSSSLMGSGERISDCTLDCDACDGPSDDDGEGYRDSGSLHDSGKEDDRAFFPVDEP